jgi:hypothetical protein
MSQGVEHDRPPREFVPADLPPSVVRTVQELVQARPEVREAHLVRMRLSRKARTAPTLVLLSDDSTVMTAVAEDLRRVLEPRARPGIVVVFGVDDELIHVRGLGGELKRGEEQRFPWWLLFLGI